MKTFKLVSLQIVSNGKVTPIKLNDGLIINKEDDHNRWLIEIYSDYTITSFFEVAHTEQEELLVHATITKRENDPAPFQVKVLSIQTLGNKVSILLEGTLKRDRSDYAQLLLQHLLEKGYTGEELSNKFGEMIQNKPQTFLEKK
ncbi:YwpF family protein [Bacillus sp. B1-b2]|uniref:YwpF family protein n=1 Tax=Bacillus sp. B1-b2 TaxID=2653201 RepID=UPI001261E251|nr:YwpF family protein [Bacillus sp. B1-b2]KAB7671809.1 hypothetical protein F9279_05755 [Bacillus sp. B1-b2]